MNVETELCRAIRARLVVEFDYDGHHRVVNPHSVYDSKAGARFLEGWQTGGTGSRKPPPDWGNFRLGKIAALAVTSQTFPKPQPDYNRDRHDDRYRCRL